MDEGTDFISITVEARDLPVEFQDLGPLTLAVRLPHNLIGPILDSDDAGH